MSWETQFDGGCGCSGFKTYLAGQQIRIELETRAGGVLTNPSALRFKWKAPDGTSVIWIWNTDPFPIGGGVNSVGRFYSDLNPETLKPASYEEMWAWRYETDGIETAAEGQFYVSAANI